MPTPINRNPLVVFVVEQLPEAGEEQAFGQIPQRTEDDQGSNMRAHRPRVTPCPGASQCLITLGGPV